LALEPQVRLAVSELDKRMLCEDVKLPAGQGRREASAARRVASWRAAERSLCIVRHAEGVRVCALPSHGYEFFECVSELEGLRSRFELVSWKPYEACSLGRSFVRAHGLGGADREEDGTWALYGSKEAVQSALEALVGRGTVVREQEARQPAAVRVLTRNGIVGV